MAIEILRPNGVGDNHELPHLVLSYQYPTTNAEHWTNLDEDPANDDTDYIFFTRSGVSATTKRRDLYTIPTHSVGFGVIYSVTVHFRGKYVVGTAPGTIKCSLKTNSTVVDGTDQGGLTSSYADYSQSWATNPVTAVSWTWDEIDALQVGLWGSAESDNYYLRVTQLYVEVNYDDTPSALATPKGTTYIYKQYNNNVFVGILDKVVSPFQLTSEINTAGSQLLIDLGVSFENSSSQVSYDLLVTETPENIVSEAGETISGSSSVVLDGIPTLNDRIEVWEISDTDPTGRLVFNGLVSKWSANYSNDTTRLTVLSYGVQLDNYLVQIVPNSEVVSNPITNSDASINLSGSSAGSGDTYLFTQNAVCQSFQVPTSLNISSISVDVNSIINPYKPNQSRCSLSLYEGTPLSKGALLGSVNISLITGLGTLTFTFSTPISLSSSTDYFFDCIGGGSTTYGGSQLFLSYQTTGSYSGGKMYEHLRETLLTNIATDTYTETSHDLIFSIITSSGAISSQFLSYDPSNIVKGLLNSFISLGGNLSYTDDSIDLSGTTVSYTFKFNTYYEALQKCVELAPANWYWYVDPGTGVVYFKTKSTSADHTLIKGKHINNFEIGQSLEDVTNLVYFTGGATVGVNLQVYNLNTTSISLYGQWLETQADNRVTDSDSAGIIIQGILDQKSEPRFIIPNVTVLASAYDISTLMVGQCVGFANFNNLVNSLILQIMSITYTPDSAVLKLEVLPPTQSKRLEDIKRNLDAQQTENNPAT